ncbi:urease accessory protein UreD [Herbaspirillum sp. WKF16]|jgi:urease accessory protein|uniref:urease accessory protein UreD n=1 Tax=Herbaspirillum sp. WKF16 TaxID=3028312 RepID=UPI0023A92837|nr:urease accessory protein UreD [Herbaspirillum sp. WKF16]WDZ96096.1 urease accessory protein UreD [Herbaspirillum sp. WKF16]
MKRITGHSDSASAPASPRAEQRHAPDQARLALEFADDAGTTRLVRRRHFGPLRVQKPLYPEHPSVCHAIIVHPPGGIVGGDQLTIDAEVGAGAHALLTTPGAGKWYRANGAHSRQGVTLRAGAGASLEWLPQETIFFDAAEVNMEHSVELAADAAYLGAEILCFGRTASGERFGRGAVAQRTEIRRGGKLVWFEQGRQQAERMGGPLALDGRTVCGTLIAVGDGMDNALLAALREATGALALEGRSGATLMKQVLVARYLGDSSLAARQWLHTAWQVLRPAVAKREAAIPRIWNT